MLCPQVRGVPRPFIHDYSDSSDIRLHRYNTPQQLIRRSATSFDDGAGDAERGLWHRSAEPSATTDPIRPSRPVTLSPRIPTTTDGVPYAGQATPTSPAPRQLSMYVPSSWRRSR